MKRCSASGSTKATTSRAANGRRSRCRAPAGPGRAKRLIPRTAVHPLWGEIAERIADALGACDGELIQVRDRTGRYDVLQEILLALERRGATPLPELLPGTYLTQLLATTS